MTIMFSMSLNVVMQYHSCDRGVNLSLDSGTGPNTTLSFMVGPARGRSWPSLTCSMKIHRLSWAKGLRPIGEPSPWWAYVGQPIMANTVTNYIKFYNLYINLYLFQYNLYYFFIFT